MRTQAAAFAIVVGALSSLGCMPCKVDGDCAAAESCQAGACKPAPRVCAVAETLACSCADGSASTRTCAADGQIGRAHV